MCELHTTRDMGAANTGRQQQFLLFQVQTNSRGLSFSFTFHMYGGRHAFIFTAERVTGSFLFASFVGYLNTMSLIFIFVPHNLIVSKLYLFTN